MCAQVLASSRHHLLIILHPSYMYVSYEVEFVLFLAVLEYKYLSWVYGVDRKICHEGH